MKRKGRIAKRWRTLDGRRRALVVGGLAVLGLAVVVGDALWSSTRAAVRHLTNLPRVEAHAPILREVGAEFGFDPNLLAALMLAESGGDVGAQSHADALGLFQLMLPTARDMARRLKIEEPSSADLLRDAHLNARLGTCYLAWLENQFDGELEAMLVAYNMGPGRLKQRVAEAGSFAAWLAERRASGESGVAAYVDKILHYRGVFAERGRITGPVAQSPLPQ